MVDQMLVMVCMAAAEVVDIMAVEVAEMMQVEVVQGFRRVSTPL
jgi:hypothetical protein